MGLEIIIGLCNKSYQSIIYISYVYIDINTIMIGDMRSGKRCFNVSPSKPSFLAH